MPVPIVTRRQVKLGTMPGYAGWVRYTGTLTVGARLEYRERNSDPWRPVRIWQIGPPPDNRLYLDLE